MRDIGRMWQQASTSSGCRWSDHDSLFVTDDSSGQLGGNVSFKALCPRIEFGGSFRIGSTRSQ
jgi:hypothetical protein